MEKLVKKPDASTGQDFRIVKNCGEVDSNSPLIFTFSNFKLNPIKIDGEFNNHFLNEADYIRKISILIGKALPLFSNETHELFTDHTRTNAMHIHKLDGKEDILKKIFIAYQYNEKAINNFLEGAEIYQLEVPYENGATRVVYEKIDNLISFLFLDPNHHIYMNPKFVKNNHSLFYEYCPVLKNHSCERMKMLQTCFAFEYLDEEKYNQSYYCTYTPDSNKKA